MAHLLKTAELSFFRMAEDLIPSPDERRPLVRIFSLMRKASVAWLRYDQRITRADLRLHYPALWQEIQDLRKEEPKTRVQVTQLTFYRQRPRKRGGATRETAVREPALLGTCILLRLNSPDGRKRRRYIYEALISADALAGGARGPDYVVDLSSECTLVVAGRYFSALATYYAQQDGQRTVCAHACLKAAIWNSDPRDGSDWTFAPTTRWMNDIARQVAPPGWQPRKGMTPQQVKAICEELDLDLRIIPFTHFLSPGLSPYEVAYLYASSGFPTLLVFKPSHKADDVEHLVPILGHRANPGEWLPIALSLYEEMPPHGARSPFRNFLPSVEWVSDLLIHDDLLGPYFSLSAGGLPRRPDMTDDYCGHATAVWVIGPRGICEGAPPNLAQIHAGVLVPNLVRDLWRRCPAKWRARLQWRWGGRGRRMATSLVLRTRFVTREDYVEHLRRSKDHLHNRSGLSARVGDQVAQLLPEDMWMVEYTLPELRSANSAKIGEVLFPFQIAPPAGAPSVLQAESGDQIDQPVAHRFFGLLQLGADHELTLGFSSHIPFFRR